MNTAALEDKVLEYLLATPKALATIFLSWMSGHLWAYIILIYVAKNKKGKNYIDGKVGKTAIGLLWFALIMVPIYYLQHDTLKIQYESLLDSAISALLYGLVAQAIIFIFITTTFAGENK